jgi:hypothetical protein
MFKSLLDAVSRIQAIAKSPTFWVQSSSSSDQMNPAQSNEGLSSMANND